MSSIRVAVKVNAVLTEDVAKWDFVDDKEERPQSSRERECVEFV